MAPELSLPERATKLVIPVDVMVNGNVVTVFDMQAADEARIWAQRQYMEDISTLTIEADQHGNVFTSTDGQPMQRVGEVVVYGTPTIRIEAAPDL